MKDELISFETAKLAKEKGFDEDCNNYYTPEGKHESLDEGDIIDNTWIGDKFERDGFCTTPTQTLLQRWLRENHSLHIYPFGVGTDKSEVFNAYVVGGIFTTPELLVYESYTLTYKTYEEALEIALKEALNTLN